MPSRIVTSEIRNGATGSRIVKCSVQHDAKLFLCSKALAYSDERDLALARAFIKMSKKCSPCGAEARKTKQKKQADSCYRSTDRQTRLLGEGT
ncbi:hypothetical protein PoB_007348900 [Plakobranchus ocellatus]|uniref:Uncharacterized protein n=1 Tax=Plakobranchus ocellatus TaxID=259542 RepID=A0AAV4DS46_9GAST|nr:hypothetical protein PoB_007348900 [Plakobranchus ocellatus]